MKKNLKFWGVRGTCPVSGPGQTAFGGNTPCASLETPDGRILVLDAGTGIRNLGQALMTDAAKKPVAVHLLLTHFHLDHLMGLPFFAPLYHPDARITIYAEPPPGETERLLEGLMGGRYFPVAFKDTPAETAIRTIPKGGLSIGATRVSSCSLRHPQGSVALKFANHAGCLVFATDTEHPGEGVDERLCAFVEGVDLLIYDATFTPEEYEDGKQGWGHSTWQAGTLLAKKAGVKELCLSHFNPEHSDARIEEMLRKARAAFPHTSAAREQGLGPQAKEG